MSNVKVDPTSPESAPTQAPTAAEVWERVHNAAPAPEPITKDEVKGVKPGEEPKERKLVAPEVQEFINKGKPPETNPLEERLARIEAALSAPTEEAPKPGLEDEVRALKQALLEKEQREEQARAEAEREQSLQTFREGVVSNIDDQPDRFPFLIALGMQTEVFNTLIARLEAGESVSEDDIASEAEAKYAEAFEKMQQARTTTKSQERPASEPKTQPTLTPSLSGAEGPNDIDTIMESAKGDRRAAAAQLWNAIHSG